MTKVLKAKYGATDRPLCIGDDVKIPCYVLEDGRRVIVQRGLYKALGITQGGGRAGYREFGGAARIAAFIDQNKLISLEANVLEALQNPVVFMVNKTEHHGYEATLLQEIVRSISKAYLKGNLSPRNAEVGARAEMLDDAFGKVGITALVDEATGYQEIRERDELHKILKVYISAELLPWQKTFPDSFYKEIFRLNGWDFSVSGIKKRPGVVGKWTNKYIYEQLPKGVIDELKSNTPKSAAGNYTSRFFQSLTADTGHPHLNNQINQVIALMKISDNWEQFESYFDKMWRRTNGDQELPFDNAA